MRLPTLPWFVECLKEHKSARKLGARIEYGREPFTRAVASESIVLIDVQRGEGLESYASLSPKPGGNLRLSDGNKYHYPLTRAIAGEALIIAISTVAGPRRQDHVELCDLIVNNLVNALYETAKDSSKALQIQNGGYLKAREDESGALEDGFVEIGCRYLLRFFIDCPVVSKPISVATIGPAPDVTFETTVNVPYDGDHEITFPSGEA